MFSTLFTAELHSTFFKLLDSFLTLHFYWLSHKATDRTLSEVVMCDGHQTFWLSDNQGWQISWNIEGMLAVCTLNEPRLVAAVWDWRIWSCCDRQLCGTDLDPSRQDLYRVTPPDTVISSSSLPSCQSSCQAPMFHMSQLKMLLQPSGEPSGGNRSRFSCFFISVVHRFHILMRHFKEVKNVLVKLWRILNSLCGEKPLKMYLE